MYMYMYRLYTHGRDKAKRRQWLLGLQTQESMQAVYDMQICMHNAESYTHKTTPQDGQLIVHVGHQ